jgi:hypothetical protein
MCTGAEFAAAFAAAASTANTVAESQRGPKVDPAAERAKAEAEATTRANGKISMTRKAMRENSLLTGGGSLGAPAAPAAGGRRTLGV